MLHTICLVGKSSSFQVKNALEISEDENLSMLNDSFNYLKKKIKKLFMMLNIFLMVLKKIKNMQ